MPDPKGAAALRAALTLDRALLLWALAALVAGGAAALAGRTAVADAVWAAGILPTLVPLAWRIVRALLRGETRRRHPGRAVAMAGALALGEQLAGAVIALMLAGGNVLEDYAGRRARGSCPALLEPRAARRAPRRDGALAGRADVEDVAARRPAAGQARRGRAGRRHASPSAAAVLDESALTGEALPVDARAGRRACAAARSTPAAPFDLRADAHRPRDSTYAGIVRLVEAAQAREGAVRAPRRPLRAVLPAADPGPRRRSPGCCRGDPVRALAVLVVATPCPLILAAPVAIVAGISRAARRGRRRQGRRRARGAGPGAHACCSTRPARSPPARRGVVARRGASTACRPDEVLRLAASLDQVSPHVAGRRRSSPRRRGRGPGARHAERRRGDARAPGSRAGSTAARVAARQRRASSRRGPRGAGRRTAAATATATVASWRSTASRPGVISLADPIRADAPRALRALRARRHAADRDGDRRPGATSPRRSAAALGVDAVLAERTPADKVDAVRAERGRGRDRDGRRRHQRRAGAGRGRRRRRDGRAGRDGRLRGGRRRAARRPARPPGRRHRRSPAARGGSRCRACSPAWGCRSPAMVAAALGLPAAGRRRAAAGGDRRRGDPERAAGACGGAGPAARRLAGRRGARPARPSTRRLAPVLDRLRRLADALGTGDGPRLRAACLEVDALLTGRAPAARARPTRPGCTRASRRCSAAATRWPRSAGTHREIAHLARRLHRLATGLPGRRTRHPPTCRSCAGCSTGSRRSCGCTSPRRTSSTTASPPSRSSPRRRRGRGRWAPRPAAARGGGRTRASPPRPAPGRRRPPPTRNR